MDYQELRQYRLKKPEAVEEFPFGLTDEIAEVAIQYLSKDGTAGNFHQGK